MRALLALLALAAVLALPGSAAADDQSVWDAYARDHRAELGAAVKAYGRAMRPRAAIAAGGRVSRVLERIADDVALETPSTADGQYAKELLLDSLAAWRHAMALDARSLRALRRGRLARGNAVGLRSSQELLRADRFERRAVRALRLAGVEL